jgi:tRNA dimethylallyltransferase
MTINPASKTVIIVAGATASGKTALAIALAQFFNTAVLSADSRQCYREMTIGTAKPTPEEQATVPHYFIDSHSIHDEVNAAVYEQYGLQVLEQIFAKHDVAVVCGGTGLYIKALLEGIDEMPDVDAAIKAEIEMQYHLHGKQWLQEQLLQADPLFAAKGEMENPARMLRALSFVRSTGQSLLNFHGGTPKPRPFKVIKLAIDMDRELLYSRINRRVELMMEAGQLAEAETLFPERHLKPLQTVGYSELFEYLEGQCTLDFAIDKMKQHTRNYAKRQLTWFRKDKEYSWVNATDTQAVIAWVQQQLAGS